MPAVLGRTNCCSNEKEAYSCSMDNIFPPSSFSSVAREGVSQKGGRREVPVVGGRKKTLIRLKRGAFIAACQRKSEI